MSDILPNFLDLPPSASDPATARYVVLPVPFEETVSYRGGTRLAPAAILNASGQVELFDEELREEFVCAGIATLPALLPKPTADGDMPRLRQLAGEIFAAGKFLLALGGEHSITAPLVRAALQQYTPLSVLQIDAHADLRDTYGGLKYSHACVMRRVLELGCDICQVGIRSYSQEEFDSCRLNVDRFVTPQVTQTDPAWIDSVLSRLSENTYITVDMDGLDPSIAPGVGTPEPGGLSWRQVTALLRRVCSERNVVAADIVETRPLGENHVTEFLAARLAYKIIAYAESRKRQGR